VLEAVETFLGSPPADLVRLVAVPVFGWAAYRDIRTRRVPNETWLPLALLGVALLAWETTTGTPGEPFFLSVALSLGLVAPIGYLFYWFGGFGGADAKALVVLAVLFPAYPVYFLPGDALPLYPTYIGVFSLTILTNTVLVGAAYPLAVATRNAAAGHLGTVMFFGKPVRVADLPTEHGSLLETPGGFTRRGLDLDALRMYLRWRGCSLADLRDDPERYRDPDSLPAHPSPPGDGAVGRDAGDGASGGPDAESVADGTDVAADGDRDPLDPDPDDEWGAQAFLDDIEGDAYGTTPEKLRTGLAVVSGAETVWISPGLPFIVPMFVGLLVSLVYGDVLVRLIAVVT
jgi:preflagellin peptidase FlaK